ncbi:MAG: hypothetical protein Q4E72_10205 [bacterium]|nr:hypothetical protein [bacterium]
MFEYQETFGQSLKSILTSRGIAAASLSDALGFSSRTSLYRILNDESSANKAEKLLELLQTCPLLKLTLEEEEHLRALIEIERCGLDEFLYSRAFRSLLFPQMPPGGAYTIHVEDLPGGRQLGMDIDDTLLRLAGQPGAAVRLHVTGQMSGALASAMYRLISACHENGVEVRVCHYLDGSSAGFAGTLACLLPMVYLGGYEIRCYDGSRMHGEMSALMSVTAIYAVRQTPCGEAMWYHMVATAPDHALVYLCTEAEYQAFRRLIECWDDSSSPVSGAFLSGGSPQDCLRFAGRYRELEHDREALLIRSCIPYSLIPAKMLQDAAYDIFMAQGSGGGDDEAAQRASACLRDVHHQRWENIRRKRKTTHLILDRSGMLELARTGRMRSRLCAIRPFTIEERLTLLCDLKEQLLNNPYFNAYFYLDESAVIRDEISLYTGGGMLLARGERGCRPSRGCPELLITQTEFCERFRRFFYEQLLGGCVTPLQQTLRYLDEMIDEVRQML